MAPSYREVNGLFMKLHFLRRSNLQRQEASSGLYFGQQPFLDFVVHHPGRTQKEVADAFHITPAAVATSAKRLEKAGMLTKEADPANLRQNRLFATARGLAVSREFHAVLESYDARSFAGFSEEELRQLAGYLARILKNLGGDGDAPPPPAPGPGPG